MKEKEAVIKELRDALEKKEADLHAKTMEARDKVYTCVCLTWPLQMCDMLHLNVKCVWHERCAYQDGAVCCSVLQCVAVCCSVCGMSDVLARMGQCVAV